MIIKREIGQKGQVVIPKDIRLMLGLMPKQKVVFEVNGGDVSIKPEQNPEEWLEQFLRYRKKGKGLSLKELKKIEGESYDLS